MLAVYDKKGVPGEPTKTPIVVPPPPPPVLAPETVAKIAGLEADLAAASAQLSGYPAATQEHTAHIRQRQCPGRRAGGEPAAADGQVRPPGG